MYHFDRSRSTLVISRWEEGQDRGSSFDVPNLTRPYKLGKSLALPSSIAVRAPERSVVNGSLKHGFPWLGRLTTSEGYMSEYRTDAIDSIEDFIDFSWFPHFLDPPKSWKNRKNPKKPFVRICTFSCFFPKKRRKIGAPWLSELSKIWGSRWI